MDTADELLDAILSWLGQQKRCAEQLRKLATELESLRGKCNGGNCVGNSVSVVGAACLIGAGVATFFTGGAAAPFLGVLGAVYGGTGVAVTVGTMITEHFMTSDTMKDAEKLAQSNNEQGKKIQELLKRLKKEREEWDSEEETDEEDMYVVDRILAAMARRSGVPWHAEVDTSKRNKPADVDTRRHNRQMLRYYRNDMYMRQMNPSLNHVALLGFVGLFTLSTLKTTGGKTGKTLFTTGAGALAKNISKTGLKTAVKGGALIAGGVVGLALTLPDAIDNWKQLVKTNHVTEASQSLKDTAQEMEEASGTLKKELDAMREMFDEMAKNPKDNTHQYLCNDEEKESDQDQHSETDQGTYSDEEEIESNQEVDQDERNDTDSDKERESDQDQESNSDSQENDTNSDQESETDQHQGAKIRMLLQNFRSLNNKFPDLSKIIRQFKPDILLATETWFRNEVDVDRRLQAALPPNYSFCHEARKTRKRGGGVATIYSDAFRCEQIHLTDKTAFEHLAVVLESDELPSPIVVINVYYPPGYPEYQRFLQQFDQLLQAIPSQYNDIIIAGDFNIPIDDDTRSTRQFNELLERHGFRQRVNTPTHSTDFTHQRDHILDLVITRGLDGSVSVRKSNISDHYSVIFDVTPKSNEADKKKKTKKKQNETKREKKS